MSDEHSSPESGLEHSLASVRELRRTAMGSIILMAVGIAAVIGAFVYSITRLQPLEREISEKQKEIQRQTTELDGLKNKIAEAGTELEDVTTKLSIARKALNEAEGTLKEIAAGVENPRGQAQRVLPAVTSAATELDTSKRRRDFPPEGSLAVDFEDEQGKPIKDLQFLLTLTPVSGPVGPIESRSNFLHRIPAGLYAVTVRARGYYGLQQQVNIVEGGTEHIIFRMAKVPSPTPSPNRNRQ